MYDIDVHRSEKDFNLAKDKPTENQATDRRDGLELGSTQTSTHRKKEQTLSTYNLSETFLNEHALQRNCKYFDMMHRGTSIAFIQRRMNGGIYSSLGTAF